MVTAIGPFTPPADTRTRHTRRAGDRAPGHAGVGQLDDVTLLAAISTRDAAALDQLYARYRPLAFATAFALLKDANAAEDAVQDAFLSVWRAATSFQPGRGSARAWLLTIVRNSAIDGLRARQLARRQHAALANIEATSWSEEDVSTTIVMSGDAHRLRVALTALPLPQRDSVELAFFGGLSHCEIAERTAVPLGAVKGRIRLGLQRLRQDLTKAGPRSGPAGVCPCGSSK